MGILEKIHRWRRNLKGHAECYGGCRRCGDRWNWKESHTIQINPTDGMFPVCEECWNQIRTEERLYYARLLFEEHERWAGCNNYSWAEVEAAIKASGE